MESKSGMNNQNTTPTKTGANKIKYFTTRLDKANEQLAMIGAVQIPKPDLDFQEIPLDDEYKIAFNAHMRASAGLQEGLTKTYPGMFSLLFALSSLLKGFSYPQEIINWVGFTLFFFVALGFFWLYSNDAKTVGSQAIVDAILEHRNKKQESTNGAPSTQNTGTDATDIDPKLKQTILEALQEHHAHHPQNPRPRGFKIFFPRKNK